ncbi:MAG: hypothetical protein V4732_13565 [Pseudomonadota bacterium]
MAEKAQGLLLLIDSCDGVKFLIENRGMLKNNKLFLLETAFTEKQFY